MVRNIALALAASLLAAAPVLAQEQNTQVTVTGGKEDRSNVPVKIQLDGQPAQVKTKHVLLKEAGTNTPLVGQITGLGIISDAGKSKAVAELHFVIPQLQAATTRTFVLSDAPQSPIDSTRLFHFKKSTADYTELWRGSQPVFRYMHAPYDNSSEDRRNKTYKVFHHLFDPTSATIVTNGGQSDPGAESKKLLYPHHRGLMFAFNKITYDGKSADTWHAKPRDTHEAHAAFLSAEEGPVLGRHCVAITWHGPDNDVFANEEREMTVYAVEGGTLLEFATRLKSASAKVRLDGDPQHAGFQFRAHNDVANTTAKQTYYLRPDGRGAPDETRNWDAKKKGPVNLPWDALCFILHGKRYTVAYLDHPRNPGEKRYSERNYGRFGCYFEYDLTPENPLVLNHRVWLQNGEMTGAQVQALRDAFVSPPHASIK